MFTLVGGVIRRCQDCRRRQVWFGPTSVPLDKIESDGGLLAELALIAIGVTLVLLAGLFIVRMN